MAAPMVLATTKNMDGREWLEMRRKGIGSSDAPAICGLSKFASPYTVWLEKTGQVPLREDSPSESAYWGTQLEDIVAREFQVRTGYQPRRRLAILQHPQHPHMLANVDRVINDPVRGGRGVLEIKTTSAYMKGDWEGDKAPFYAQVQLQHQLAVTGFRWGALAVLIGGQEFRHVFVCRDHKLISHLITVENDFWRLVEAGTPPPMDGSEATSEALAAQFPEATEGREVLLPLEADDLIGRFLAADEQAKAAAAIRDQARNRLQALMGDAEVGLIAGHKRVFWPSFVAKRVDSKALAKERPDIYQAYSKESAYRKFSVKEA